MWGDDLIIQSLTILGVDVDTLLSSISWDDRKSGGWKELMAESCKHVWLSHINHVLRALLIMNYRIDTDRELSSILILDNKHALYWLPGSVRATKLRINSQVSVVWLRSTDLFHFLCDRRKNSMDRSLSSIPDFHGNFLASVDRFRVIWRWQLKTLWRCVELRHERWLFSWSSRYCESRLTCGVSPVANKGQWGIRYAWLLPEKTG